jgi:hypothetical protein
MSKPIRVYSHDSNPAIDKEKFCTTRHDADDRVAKGYACYIGFNRLQLAPPRGSSSSVDQTNTITSALFDQAWGPRWSGNYLVMQMRPSSSDQPSSSESTT